MAGDKYSAVWVSHSSMGDFLKCPRSYYLHNVYKNPKTGRKINIVSPALSLGTAVHEVVEGLADFKVEDRINRFTEDALMKTLDMQWKKVSGKMGGFKSDKEEKEFKDRAVSMIHRVQNNPTPLLEKTVKIKGGENGLPPNFLFSEEDNIILCGKIDWLVYDSKDDSVHILDFKTGKNEESEESLQLPIYQLLLKNLQKRKVNGASYWYLDRDDSPIPTNLPDVDESYNRVYEVARQVKNARAMATIDGREEAFLCPKGVGGCFACQPFEKIIRGQAECVGVGEMRQDLYIL